MDESNPNFPTSPLIPSEAGSEFIGLAVIALPVGAMNDFGFNLLRVVVERELKLASVNFDRAWLYNQALAHALFRVSDWRGAAGSLRNSLEGLGLLVQSGIYRYDFSEGFWRRLHGTWPGDFKIVLESLSPEFQADQMAKVALWKNLMEKQRARNQNPPESES